MLGAACLAGLAAGRPGWLLLPALLLLLAGLRGQDLWRSPTLRWGADSLAWAVVAGASLLTLLAAAPSPLLFAALGVSALLLGALLVLPGGGRVSVWGQGAGALAAATGLPLIAATGAAPPQQPALAAWGLMSLYYLAGITNTRATIAVGTKSQAAEWRRNLAVATVVLVLLVVVASSAGRPGQLAAVGLAGEVARLAAGARWQRERPPLKRVGLTETALAIWVAAWLAAALRAVAAGA